VATWQAAVDHGFFIILDLAIGGAYPNRICACTSPTTATSSGAGMSVGYVAVYQTAGTGAATTATTATTAVPPAVTDGTLVQPLFLAAS